MKQKTSQSTQWSCQINSWSINCNILATNLVQSQNWSNFHPQLALFGYLWGLAGHQEFWHISKIKLWMYCNFFQVWKSCYCSAKCAENNVKSLTENTTGLYIILHTAQLSLSLLHWLSPLTTSPFTFWTWVRWLLNWFWWCFEDVWSSQIRISLMVRLELRLIKYLNTSLEDESQKW